MRPEISCFISPHGLGHAARTAAVLEAAVRAVENLQIRLFTSVDEQFFSQSPFNYTYHRTVSDVGLVQRDSFRFDLSATIDQLGTLLPFQPETIHTCASICQSSSLILCDISPLGIVVGKQCGIRTLLLENFTWDWIYKPLSKQDRTIEVYLNMFADYYLQADLRIQTEPVCQPMPGTLHVPPIARKSTGEKEKIKQLLGSDGRPIVLISMGGSPLALPFLEMLAEYPEYLFLIAGQSHDGWPSANVRLMAFSSPFQHPDLINGADLLVCKCGYSTIAECSQTSTSICAIARDDFAESSVIERFVTEQMNGTVLSISQFLDGSWLDRLPQLLNRTRPAMQSNGAESVAACIASLLT